MSPKHNCKFYHSKIEKLTDFSQKVYKLSKAKLSRFEGTRGDKKQIFRTLINNRHCHRFNTGFFFPKEIARIARFSTFFRREYQVQTKTQDF